MKKSKSADVLADPGIQCHTERILALREEERQTREKLGAIIAAIGAELIAVKEALDKQIALERMQAAVARLITSEMLGFGWLKSAQNPAFKEVLALLK